MIKYKLGKKPVNAGLPTFAFKQFFDITKLPKRPSVFGHSMLLPGRGLGMLGNDQCGDCVPCAAAHLSLYWNVISGHQVQYSAVNVIKDYAAATGYVPGNDASDQGTELPAYLERWRTVGITDAFGQKHFIDGWVKIDIGDTEELLTAMWLFDGLAIGILLTQAAEDQFDEQVPWTPVSNQGVIGGHGICAYGNNSNGDLVIATWGALQGMSMSMLANCDEAYACLSFEALNAKGVTIEGFDKAALVQVMATLKGG